MIINLLTLFYTFFKIGLFTIGGGYAMLPLITDEVTNNHKWSTVDEIIDFIAIAESTPGPFAVNLSTFIGMRVGGILGVIAAVVGVTLPSFIIILLIAKFFHKFVEYKYVQAALYTLRPTTIGLMCSAVISFIIIAFNLDFSIFQTASADFISSVSAVDFDKIKEFFFNINFLEIAIFTIIFIMTKKLKLNAYFIIIFSALFGIVFYSLEHAFTLLT